MGAAINFGVENCYFNRKFSVEVALLDYTAQLKLSL
jgi:hypothetical protein